MNLRGCPLAFGSGGDFAKIWVVKVDIQKVCKTCWKRAPLGEVSQNRSKNATNGSGMRCPEGILEQTLEKYAFGRDLGRPIWLKYSK